MKKIICITALCLTVLGVQTQTINPTAPVGVAIPFEKQFDPVKFENLAWTVQVFIKSQFVADEKIKDVFRNKEDKNLLVVKVVNSDGAELMFSYEEDAILKQSEEKETEEEETEEEATKEDNPEKVEE